MQCPVCNSEDYTPIKVEPELDEEGRVAEERDFVHLTERTWGGSLWFSINLVVCKNCGVVFASNVY